MSILREKSAELFARGEKLIPGGVNSNAHAFTSVDADPIVVSHGKGDTLYDIDGHAFVDYIGAWGSLILGHADPDVVAGVKEEVEKGASFGMSTELPYLLAEKIITYVHSVEKVRFCASGTEATMTALRLAKGVTGREEIVKFEGNYHGHHGLGDHVLPYNDVERVRSFLRKNGDSIAAVILEPVAGNMGVVPATHEFLQMLREETRRVGAVLIFDEVMCGFRVGLNCASGLYDIHPDLTTFGKIITGGFPGAALGGRSDLMDQLTPIGPVFHAGTHSGMPVSMRAGLETFKKIEQLGFYEDLQRKTRLITEPLEAMGVGSMFCLSEREKFNDLFCHLFERGIFIPPSADESVFVSAAHTDEHLKEFAQCVLDFYS